MQTGSGARLAWALWGLTAALVIAAFVFFGLTVHTRLPTGGTSRPGDIIFPVGYLVFATVGTLIATRHPRNYVGWIFCVLGVLIGLWALTREYSIYSYFTHPGRHILARLALWLEIWIWAPAAVITTTFVFLLFPDGRLANRRWRPVWWLSALSVALMTLVFALSPNAVNDFPQLRNPYGIHALDFFNARSFSWLLILPVSAILGAAASLVIRFRRSHGDEREQLKWFATSGAFLAAVFTAAIVGPQQTPVALSVLLALAFTSVPVAAGIAIFKYRLYDIDVVINRAVLYGILAAFITGIYVAIVVGVGAAVGTRGKPYLAIAATALIAVAFQPARDRARRLANRLVYGERATPYEVLSELGERLAGVYATEDVLPRLVRIVASGTGAHRAAVWLRVGGELRLAASWPESERATARVLLLPGGEDLASITGEPLAFPVRHQGELLGALTIAMPPGDALTPGHERLLRNLSSQAGLMLRNVRLIAELRASRQRLVAAQDQERRRLERNIHDGAQQQLVALAVKANLARSLVGRDQMKEADLLDQLKSEAQDALENLRDLARGIYPPLLADQGLVAALTAQARKSPVGVSVQADGIGRFSQDAEAAVYFCTLEALQNVAKYAKATGATVHLYAGSGHLVFEVTDNGLGFDSNAKEYGTGMQGMADRLAALGGELSVTSSPGEGTVVTGRVPIAIVDGPDPASARP